MTRITHAVSRRHVLQTLGTTAVAVGLGVGTAGASQHCDDTVSDGQSIQAAIDAASPGDTICVEAGTYPGDLFLYVDDLTVEGPNAGTPGYGDREDEATVTGQVVLNEDGATVDGLDVSPPAATSTQSSEAVRISNTPDDVTVRNTVVREFERDDPSGGFYGVDGINVFGGDGANPVSRPTVQGNLVHGLRNPDQAGAAGISVQGNVESALVDANVVRDVGQLVTAYGFGVVIRGTGNHGVVPRDVTVRGNRLRTVRSDPASPYDGVGFEVEADGTGYAATHNRVTDTDLGVEVKVAADETTVTWNDVAGNHRLGVWNRDDATLTATENWWGHASGPGGPGGRRNPADREVGRGDDIEGDVAFDPWLRRSIDHPSR